MTIRWTHRTYVKDSSRRCDDELTFCFAQLDTNETYTCVSFSSTSPFYENEHSTLYQRFQEILKGSERL